MRQEAHAAACRDYERFIEDAERLTGRETFLSPRRVFRVVRSAGSLSGLELSDEQVLLSDQELGREIVAVLEQIDQRAVVDETQEQAKYPGMSALRRSNQTLASLWEGRD